MKQIMLNLKRFDVPKSLGGVNSLCSIRDYGKTVVERTQTRLRQYAGTARFVQYYPEAQLIGALEAKSTDSNLEIGCQGVYFDDVLPGGNFGAFTSLRPAAAMVALGCTSVIIGHCEERQAFENFLHAANCGNSRAVNEILNREILQASSRDLSVLYCIGEKEEEHSRWKQVLRMQLETGLSGVDLSGIVIAYEPIWSIGPGKTPAGEDHIRAVTCFIKELTDGVPVIYGGGLKKENAGMLGGIQELDGGLIALTRFGTDFGFYPDEYLEIIDTYLNP